MKFSATPLISSERIQEARMKVDLLSAYLFTLCDQPNALEPRFDASSLALAAHHLPNYHAILVNLTL